jgi:predicted  nucleic acid-binding Zn-ribbon protein
MPHQCTACGHTFEDGSKEMLSGCPDCGGNKFQFRPAGASSDEPTHEADSSTDESDPATRSATDKSTPASTTNDSTASSTAKQTTDTPEEPPDRPSTGRSSVTETVGRATTKVRDFVSSDPVEPDAEWPDDWESGSSVSEPSPNRPNTNPSDFSEDPDEQGGDIIDADARRAAGDRADERGENAAQASARTDVVSSDELDHTASEESSDDSPASEEFHRAPSGEFDPTASEGLGQTTGAESETTVPPDPADERTDDPAPDGEIVSEPTGEEPDLAELRDQLNDQFESIKILEPGQYELNLMELYDREEYIIALQENGRYVIQVPEQWIGEDLEDR